MALVKCKECGHQVSTKAKQCPSCGAKAPSNFWILVGVIIVVAILINLAGKEPSNKNTIPTFDSLVEKARAERDSLNAINAGNPTETPQSPIKSYLDILSINTRITDTNEVYFKYAWLMTVRNNTNTIQRFNATIQFVDSDGFIIEEDYAPTLLINAGEEKQYAGSRMVGLPGARSVTGCKALVKTF